MFTFYCVAKTAAKTKTTVSLKTGIPKKSNICKQPDRVLFCKVRSL